MKLTIPLIAALIALAAHDLAEAEPGSSMRQARSEIDKGTWTGTVLYKSKPAAETPAIAASAPAGGSALTQAVEPKAGASAPAPRTPSFTERLGAILGRGEPLSRQPMDQSKRLDSPSIGTPLPTASSGAGASAAGR